MLEMDLQSNQVVSSEALFSNTFGRLRDAAVGPDGNLYLLTSNRDGRESPAENDDRILKIVPIISQEKIGDSSKAPLKQVREGIYQQMLLVKLDMS